MNCEPTDDIDYHLSRLDTADNRDEVRWIGESVAELRAEIAAFRKFIAPVLSEHLNGGAYNPGCEVATLEAAAIAAGLLESVLVTAPCGKDCGCCYRGSFPQNCVRLTAFGREVLKCNPA